MLRDAVAKDLSKSRHIKDVDGFFFTGMELMLRDTACKAGVYSEQRNCCGLCSWHRAHVVKATCTVIQAARD